MIQRRATAGRLVPGLIGLGLGLVATLAQADDARRFFGTIISAADGRAVEGAMVTLGHGDPGHFVTVFSDEQGRYVSPALAHAEGTPTNAARASTTWHSANAGRWQYGASWCCWALPPTRSPRSATAKSARPWTDTTSSPTA